MTDMYNSDEANSLRPVLSEKEQLQTTYSDLIKNLEKNTSTLKGDNPEKHYFHSSKGDYNSIEGGIDLEVRITGTTTILEFKRKEENGDTKLFKITSDILTNNQITRLQIGHDNQSRVWKAKSHGNNHTIDLHSMESRELTIADTSYQLLLVNIDCEELFRNGNFESLDTPPSGLSDPDPGKPEDQFPWN